MFGPTGWYLDSVVQSTWYDMKAQSTRLPALETDGTGFAACGDVAAGTGDRLAQAQPLAGVLISGDPRTLFSSATGFIPFRADLGGSWVELNTGISAQIDRTTALFANAS